MNKEAMLVFGDNFIKLITYVNAGLSIVDINYDAIILDIDCSAAELGRAVKQVLMQSVVIEDGKERSKICQESILNQDIIKNKMNETDNKIRQNYGYKSNKKYEQDLMYVFLKLSLYEYLFSSSHTEKDGSTALDKDITLPSSATEEEIGAIAKKAMALCTSIYK